MSNRTRKVFFIALCLSFFILGIPVVLYSFGYRLDLKTKILTESGGIFVRSEPADAKIFVDGIEKKNESGLLNAGTFISGVLPGIHKVKVTRDGYLSFALDTEIRPLKAESFDKLLLFPTAYESVAKGDIATFFAEKNRVIIKDSTGKLRSGNRTLIGDEVLMLTADESRALTINKGISSDTYYLVPLTGTGATVNINKTFSNLKSSKLNLPGEVPIRAISLHPYDPEKIFISTKAAFYAIDLKQNSISLIEDGVDRIMRTGSGFAITRGESLFFYNLTLRSESASIGVPTDSKIFPAPTGKKVAIERGAMLEVYDADREKSLRFDISSVGNISEAFWHKDGHYLFMRGQNGLFMLQTDNEIMKPELIIKETAKAAYGDGGLLYLFGKEIRRSVL